MYGPEARALRRCLGTRGDGSPCRAWAVWAGTQQLCVAHSDTPRRTRRGIGSHWPYQAPATTPARYAPCICAAYSWPHRPGGGLCEWPLEPTYRLARAPGQHSFYWSRSSREFKQFVREFRAMSKTGRLPRLTSVPRDSRDTSIDARSWTSMSRIVDGQLAGHVQRPRAPHAQDRTRLGQPRHPACSAGSRRSSRFLPESVPVVPPLPKGKRSDKHLYNTNSPAVRFA